MRLKRIEERLVIGEEGKGIGKEIGKKKWGGIIIEKNEFGGERREDVILRKEENEGKGEKKLKEGGERMNEEWKDLEGRGLEGMIERENIDKMKLNSEEMDLKE